MSYVASIWCITILTGENVCVCVCVCVCGGGYCGTSVDKRMDYIMKIKQLSVRYVDMYQYVPSKGVQMLLVW